MGHAATLVAHKHTHNIVGVVARLSVLALGAEQLEGIAIVALKLGALPFHRDRFLENLLPSCKVLNINPPRKRRQPQEINWKQKFQKPQNENICLTYLNTENLCKREQSQARLNYAERSQGSPIGKTTEIFIFYHFEAL